MRAVFIYILTIVFTLSCAQEKRPIAGDTPFQKELNAEFKDASTSPLKKKDRKNFTSLEFFKFDSTYVVKAYLKRSPDTVWLDMKTTTDQISKKRVFGVIKFDLNGESHLLNVYQDKELLQDEAYKNYLFLPFIDETNGNETYGGGRYISLMIPKGDSITIDFNQAYNPYCAYNDKYSCPIVPRVNYLKTKVEAGVKTFDKH